MGNRTETSSSCRLATSEPCRPWMVLVAALAIAMVSCKQESTPDQPSTTETPPPVAARRSIEVQGWKDLRWGDTPDQVKQKLSSDSLVSCVQPRKSNQKGFEIQQQICRPTSKDESGMEMALLLYIDGGLGRVVVTYSDMTAHNARTDNLDKALGAKFCPLKPTLSEAVMQARQANAGQSLQAHPDCDVSAGELFVNVENKSGSSDVTVFLSGDAWKRYLEKNEFSGAF